MSKKKPLKVIAGAPDRPLVIGSIEIPCYVLEDKTRVLVQRGMAMGLGMSAAGSGQRLTVFVASKRIKFFIPGNLKVGIDNPIRFLTQGGIAYGYPATLLIDLCKVILEARDAGVLQKQQKHIAERADILIRGCATVGIIALIDEVTGYQKVREKEALAAILEEFLAKERRPWTRTFPYEFHQEIFRLKGWPMPSDGKSIKGPRVIGRYTNDLVYDRIAPGIVDELRRVNPVLANGRRRDKHHQWFIPHPGLVKLNQHLAAVMALLRAAPNWGVFHRSLERAFPKLNETIPMAFDEEG